MQYECIEEFPGLGCNVGDVVEIIKRDNGQYLIDDACLTDSETTYKHFKKKKLDGWKYSPYSFSKMETWVTCPKKFQYNYIIRPPREDVPNPILEKGTLFHGVLEFEMVDKLDEFELPDTFKALDKDAAEKIITQALDFAETSEIYNWIKSLKGIKVPEQEMFLGAELEPVDNMTIALIRGFIDLLVYDEETKSCYIFDWKTGGKSKDSLKKWPKPKDQLELYAIWANQVFDVEYIETAFVYVEHNYMAKYTFSADDIPTLKNKFKNKINNIETDKKFEKNLSQLCSWCDFRELCLGISVDRDPREITKDEIMQAGRGKPKENKRNHKNTAFLNKIKAKAKK